MQVVDFLWHQLLKKPYILNTALDQGTGRPIVLLHGIASQGLTWSYTTKILSDSPHRVFAPDLLGFGNSPKPTWVDYSVDDHARAVIATLKKQKIKSAVFVGHSMGCLIAVRIAKLQPRLVKHLILYEMPIYEGLPDTRIYNHRRDLYMALYQRVVNLPELAVISRQTIRNLVAKLSGFEISPETWQPFVKSLKNTIVTQSTLEDMRHISVSTDVIYGSFDPLVIKGKPKDIFGSRMTNISTHTIAELHAVTPRASRQIARLLEEYFAQRSSVHAHGRQRRSAKSSKR